MRGGGGGGVDIGRAGSGILGIGAQAGSHHGRCSGVLVLVVPLLTLVCCPGDKRSGPGSCGSSWCPCW